MPSESNQQSPRKLAYMKPPRDPQDLGPCLMDIVLSPGDLLYMPRGIVHKAVSLKGSASTHLTLSTYQRHTYADLVASMLPKLLERAASSSVDLRRGLPIGFLEHAGSAAAAAAAPSKQCEAFEAAAITALRSVLDLATMSSEIASDLTHEAADHIGDDFMQNRLPPFRHSDADTDTGGICAGACEGTSLPLVDQCASVPSAISAHGPLPLLSDGNMIEVRLCAPSLRRLVLRGHDDGCAQFITLQHCVGNKREGHMTRPSGATGASIGDASDEGEVDEDSEEEGQEGGAVEEEDGEGQGSDDDEDSEDDDEDDEDDEDDAWCHLVFPGSMLSPMLKLIDTYPQWLPLSKLRAPKPRKQGTCTMQAMLTGCWSDGVLETRMRSADQTATKSAESFSATETEGIAGVAEVRKMGVAEVGPVAVAQSRDHDERAWAAAVAWVQQQSAGEQAVKGVQLDSTQNGLCAVAQLPTGSCILRIPMRLLITGKLARSSPVGSTAARAAAACAHEALNATTNDLVLAFHVAAEGFPIASTGVALTADVSVALPFHAPYYATLPVGAHDPRLMLPRCWSDTDIETHLRGSPVAVEALRSRAAVLADYDTITIAARRNSPLPSDWPCFDAFDWAVAVVASRAFSLETEEGQMEALIPLADMLNHARPRDVTYSVVDGCFEMRTLQPLARGAGVHGTYGALGSAQLLVNYGFSLLYNVEPDGSGNDIRDLPLPSTHYKRTNLVYTPPKVAPLQVGPKRYSLGPLTKSMDAFRAAAFAAWERSAPPGSKRLGRAPLEVRALRRLVQSIDVELAGYSMNDESAAAILLTPPTPPKGTDAALLASGCWARRAAAAAALVLNERITLQFYQLIATICLEVLASVPPTIGETRGAATEERDSSAADRRCAAARRLRDEVMAAEQSQEGVCLEVARAGQANLREAGVKSLSDVLSALRLHASRAVAAPVALAFLQIRFPTLLK